ncbi:Rz1-like lysis system protein LysC [Entomomonas asaccharolytica]|uniref:Uncharacterized protein n=1 Tax=Entomomonas asaccharolytica TaxID=2785331 RepID=A0A974RY44_9GAMM|nr:Rz1-like lysis system protein LysC [Entomomonas asaccharolytica]QQP86931.1 hypothetical protein JHT90_06715 [Entomomonas asaccharolytica]
MGCIDKPVVTDVKIVKVETPVITPCQRLSIPDCKPINNGELYECTLTIQKNLNLCADQVDALITWQKNNDE